MNIIKNEYTSPRLFLAAAVLFFTVLIVAENMDFSRAIAAGDKTGGGHVHGADCAGGHKNEPAVYETYSIEDRKAVAPVVPGGGDREHEDHEKESIGRESAGHEGHGHESQAPQEPGHEGHDHAAGVAHEKSAAEVKIDGLIEEKVKVEKVFETVKANAVVKFHPQHYAGVVSCAPGRVRQIKVKLGDKVKKGDELLVIESVEIFNAKVDYLKNLNRYEVALSKYENIIKMGELGSFTNKNVEESNDALADARSQYEKALLARETASKKYGRVKKLVESGVSSRSELEASENELKSASIEVESLKSRLDNAQKSMSRVEKLSDSKISLKKETADIQMEFYEVKQNYEISRKYLAIVGVECEPGGPCRDHELGTFSLYSPIEGIVIEQNAVIGSSIDTQTPAVCVGDYDAAVIDIDIYEKDIAMVKNGQRVEVENIYGKIIAGRINYISNIVDPNTRTLKARAEINENSGLLKIGEFVNCSIFTAERENAITVLQSAVIEDEGRFLVFVSHGGSYAKVFVKPGYFFRDRVEIIEGLKPGNSVVTVGNYQLMNMSLSTKLELNCDSCK